MGSNGAGDKLRPPISWVLLGLVIAALTTGCGSSSAVSSGASSSPSEPFSQPASHHWTANEVVKNLCRWGEKHPTQLSFDGVGDGAYLVIRGRARRLLHNVTLRTQDVTTDTFNGLPVVSIYIGSDLVQVNFVGGVFNSCGE